MNGRITFCREGWHYLFVMLFVLGGAVLREVNLLILLAGLMVGPLLFSWRIVKATLRDLRIWRAFPARVAAGETLTVELHVANDRRRLPTWALVATDFLERWDGQVFQPESSVDLFVPVIRPGESRSANYRATITRRGRYRFSTVKLTSRFPFGFLRGTLRETLEDELTVCPRLGALTAAWHSLVESQRLGNERSRRRRGIAEADYYGLREWRTGDSRRWIHWRTSAKVGHLAVLEFEQLCNSDVSLVVDLWQPYEPTEQQRGLVELAISFGATAVVSLCRNGRNQIGLAICGKRFDIRSASASRLFSDETLINLATVEAGRGVELLEGEAATADLFRLGARTIVISSRPESPELLRMLCDESPGGATLGARQVTWIDVGDARTARFFHV